MKTLLILRHAKTQPDAPHGDHARELTDRGRRDAQQMAAHIQATAGAPDAIVTSDARRAMQTAEIVAPVVGFGGSLTVEPRVYAADPLSLLAIVHDLPDDADRVILIGHNPGLEALTATLAGVDEDEIRLRTSGLARLEFDVPRWAEIRAGTGALREIVSRHTIG